MRIRLVILVSAVTMLLAACSPTNNDSRSATAGVPNELQQLTANAWTLDSTASSLSLPSDAHITVEFTTTKRVSGRAPCNSYHGGFTIDGATIRVGPLGQTLAACPSEAASAAEHRYLMALERIDTVEPSDRDHLLLSGGTGLLLVYRATRG